MMQVTVSAVLAEVERATLKFPTWPTDPLHALAVLGEEFGELTKAALQLTYEPHKTSPDDVRAEAIQTAAMALRFAASLDRYEYRRGEQHAQTTTDQPSAVTHAIDEFYAKTRKLAGTTDTAPAPAPAPQPAVSGRWMLPCGCWGDGERQRYECNTHVALRTADNGNAGQ